VTTSDGLTLSVVMARLRNRRAAGAIPLRRYQYVDDLPVLVDGAVDVAPHAGDLDIRLVDVPPITGGVAAEPSDVDEQRREALDPPVDGDVVDLDAAFDQQFLDITSMRGCNGGTTERLPGSPCILT
jgi:hypothetical protein